MKFKFKIQQYQTDAVENTVAVFQGQPSHSNIEYRRDLGTRKTVFDDIDSSGYRNHRVELSSKAILENINHIQNLYDITPSNSLAKGVGAVNLDIEMETGTGKTYVYIKTMFELNKQYGWSKFIIVVPSIAIREGVAKSFNMLEEHFMEHYGKKARWFIYNSNNLQQLDSFSSDSGLSVMIINTQAFAASMKEDGRSKESRIIYSKRDEFGSRRPIDVIAANFPIIIMDEPQKMEGDATQKGIARFNPLFVLNYSATHKTKHDTIYALDALDAYRQKLVKRIHVKGFEVKNLRGTGGYLYLDSIVLSPHEPPKAKMEFETKNASGVIVRRTKVFSKKDNLREESGLGEYEGYVVDEINPHGYVTFLNGKTIRRGEVIGDASERNMQIVQIRETIRSHFEKERQLFRRGIKCLSLFFIDEVARYKYYDEDGGDCKGDLQKIFETEYANLLNEELQLWDDDYKEYLLHHAPEDVHRGYFSIDKNHRVVDSKVDRKTGLSDDISAYELILKNKERLLSFEEPTRFIFSHSALREGWDNPNVFQICTLRHSNSTTAKRQEVGRGLRLCVDKTGVRMDAEQLGEEVHDINKLTVIANESYADFTSALQRETREVLRERAVKATLEYFIGKKIKKGEEVYQITESDASRINIYLEDNGYIDDNKNITPKYREAVKAGSVAPLPERLQPISDGVFRLINSIFDPHALDDMVVEDKTTTPENKLNENFDKAEFQALWKEINHQYVYTVSYDSNELVEKAVNHINAELEVTQLRYLMVEGTQDEKKVDEFGSTISKSKEFTTAISTSTVKYDLVGEVAKGANLTRRTAAEILKRLKESKLILFKNNPEEFIRKVVTIIKEQKSTMIVESIRYNMTDGQYDSSIFTVKSKVDFDKAYRAGKSITDYVFSDSKGERQFAQDLDEASEVVVYAKLPRSFQIPTPVGNYAPDWAIAMKRNGVKHIFFIAETKGSMSSMELSAIEKAKIDCAEKLFRSLSDSSVQYHKVASYEDLLNAMGSIR